VSAKRVFDVISAGLGLLIAAPLLVIIALMVRLSSPGPILFKQERIGRGGRSYYLLKFRTMRVAGTPPAAPLTVGRDPRITAVGAFLRRYKLDELPQLVNVVRGEMSIVGPRPEVARYVALYPGPIREIVLSVRPGLTDEASLEFLHENELLGRAADPERAYIEEVLPRKLALQAHYVRSYSLARDLRIIMRTLAALVR
jgi:lipopolysaccharide/colanic/teichoic acid biosynthesis glycosyltransferase